MDTQTKIVAVVVLVVLAVISIKMVLAYVRFMRRVIVTAILLVCAGILFVAYTTGTTPEPLTEEELVSIDLTELTAFSLEFDGENKMEYSGMINGKLVNGTTHINNILDYTRVDEPYLVMTGKRQSEGFLSFLSKQQVLIIE